MLQVTNDVFQIHNKVGNFSAIEGYIDFLHQLSCCQNYTMN